MAKKLKTFQTSLGFYDLAIAAPSMKAALEAWGADSNLFHQGAAKESGDPEIVEATMAKPGVVLRRPVGSDDAFTEHAALPTHISSDRVAKGRPRPARRKAAGRTIDEGTSRKAAAMFEKEQRRRDSERRKEEAALEKRRERRERAVAKAEAALEKAEQEHDRRLSAIERERASLEQRAEAEQTRWDDEKAALETELRKARD
jgi:hypothetical protein